MAKAGIKLREFTAYEQAVFEQNNANFFSAALTFLKKGGTPERAAKIVAMAAEKLSGQRESVNHLTDAGHADGRGRKHDDNRPGHAAPVREPSAGQRGAACRVAKIVALTVFDSYRVRDGRPIGNVRYGELEQLRAANSSEAAVIRQIQKHTTASHDALVRDVIKPRDLERMIQKAAEIADVS